MQAEYVRNNVIKKDLKIESMDAHIKSMAAAMFKRADTSAYESYSSRSWIALRHARPPV